MVPGQVKQDNAEIATMERSISEAAERGRALIEERELLDQVTPIEIISNRLDVAKCLTGPGGEPE